jgi:hypothetical protein
MSRFFLALRCFFAVLFRRSLALDEQTLLAPDLARTASLPSLPVPAAPSIDAAPSPPAPPVQPAVVASTAEQAPAPRGELPGKQADLSEAERLAACHRGAVQLLSLLQREGRLLDFVMETIDAYSDAQVGAAVRDIHRGCRRALQDHLKILPIRSEPDEAVVRIPAGYDPSQIRCVGRVTGKPPFEGVLRHHGWRTGGVALSDIPSGHDPAVISPAEVELGA